MRPFEPKTKSPHQNLLKALKFVRYSTQKQEESKVT